MKCFVFCRIFPNYYYSLEFKLPSSSTTVQIVMIDTVVLSGNSDKDWLGLQPHGPEDDKMADDQWMWITQQLATSTYVALEIIALTLISRALMLTTAAIMCFITTGPGVEPLLVHLKIRSNSLTSILCRQYWISFIVCQGRKVTPTLEILT